MSDERRRQLNALLDAEWGRPGAPSTVVRFPWPMKRGAKVRRGPCAEILQFPAQLSGEELESRFRWTCSNEREWENEEVEGLEEDNSNENERLFKQIIQQKFGWPEPTAEAKRQRIAEGRKLIEKRNSVKDWLESLGADLDSITTPEQALFFAFDRMHASEQPASA